MIAQEKLTPFERLLFRATRGNMFLKSTSVGQVTDPTTSEKQEKSVFVVFFAGERARVKIMKASTLFLPSYIPHFATRISSLNVLLVVKSMLQGGDWGQYHLDSPNPFDSIGATRLAWVIRWHIKKATAEAYYWAMSLYHILAFAYVLFSVKYSLKIRGNLWKMLHSKHIFNNSSVGCGKYQLLQKNLDPYQHSRA